MADTSYLSGWKNNGSGYDQRQHKWNENPRQEHVGQELYGRGAHAAETEFEQAVSQGVHKHHADDDACESDRAEARELVPHESSTGGSDGAEASNVVVFTRQDENEE